MKLTQQTILITGATSGIGLHLALKLLARGNQVIICARRPEKLADLAAQHPSLFTYPCDVRDEIQCAQLATWVVATCPRLNILVNNAGLMHLYDLTQPLDAYKVMAEVATNLLAPLQLGGLLVAHLQQ